MICKINFNVFIFSLLLLLGACTHKQLNENIQYPELNKDIGPLLNAAEHYSRKYSNDADVFNNLTLPFAPLDLSNAGEVKPPLLSSYRIYCYDLFAKAFKFDVTQRKKDFNCDKECWGPRQEVIKKILPEIRKLALQFKANTDINLIAHWRMKDRFRINDWFYSEGQFLEPTPSSHLKLIASGIWEVAKPNTKLFNDIYNRALPIVEELRRLNFISVSKMKNGALVFLVDGFANETWGIYFDEQGNSPKLENEQEISIYKIDNNFWGFQTHGSRFID